MNQDNTGFVPGQDRMLSGPEFLAKQKQEARREGEGLDAFVTVKVSRELLAILSEHWSVPVRIKIFPPVAPDTHYEMMAMLADAAFLFEKRDVL